MVNPTSSRLPSAEILIQIISHFPNSDRRTLLACLLSCRTFYNVASPRLYQTIRLSSNSLNSPLYDAKPVPAPTRGPLAKRRGVVGKTGRSRKGQLLDRVKVLEVDGRMDGPFWEQKPLVLPSIRTLRFDLSNTDQFRDWSFYDRFTSFGSIRPKSSVLKHLTFHATTDVLKDLLSESTLSHVTRAIYLIEYTDSDAQFGRVHGSSNSIPSFGLHRWLDTLEYVPSSLKTVDIVFWTSAPGINFSTPSNKYTSRRRLAGQTWLDAYILHIAEQPVLSSEKIRFNFVNTGSFDRHAIMADEWDYEEVQEAFRGKLLKAIKPEKGNEFRSLSIQEWVEDMKLEGMVVGDALTDEELGPWNTEA